MAGSAGLALLLPGRYLLNVKLLVEEMLAELPSLELKKIPPFPYFLVNYSVTLLSGKLQTAPPLLECVGHGQGSSGKSPQKSGFEEGCRCQNNRAACS